MLFHHHGHFISENFSSSNNAFARICGSFHERLQIGIEGLIPFKKKVDENAIWVEECK